MNIQTGHRRPVDKDQWCVNLQLVERWMVAPLQGCDHVQHEKIVRLRRDFRVPIDRHSGR
jgi:hypothetical protein